MILLLAFKEYQSLLHKILSFESVFSCSIITYGLLKNKIRRLELNLFSKLNRKELKNSTSKSKSMSTLEIWEISIIMQPYQHQQKTRIIKNIIDQNSEIKLIQEYFFKTKK